MIKSCIYHTIAYPLQKTEMAKTESLEIENTANPSPSNDPWFNAPDNMASIKCGIEESPNGDVKTYTIDEIREHLDI